MNTVEWHQNLSAAIAIIFQQLHNIVLCCIVYIYIYIALLMV